MAGLIGEYVNVDFIEEQNTYFGYFENRDSIIFIHAKNIKSINKISKIVVEYIVQELIEAEEYTVEYLCSTIEKLKKYMEEQNINELNSLAIIQSDANTYNAVLIGDIVFKYFENGNIAFETKAMSKCLGGVQNIKAYILEDKKLHENDSIKLYNKDLDCVTILFSKILQKDAIKSNKINIKFLIITFIFLFSIVYAVINMAIVKKYDRSLDEINSDLDIYIKNCEVQNINIEISNIEKLYKQLDRKKYLIIPQKKLIKFLNNKEKIKKIKEDIKIIQKIKKEMKEAEENLNLNSYNTTRQLYKGIYIMHTNLLPIESIKKQIDKKLVMLDEIENVEKYKEQADQFFEQKEFSKARKLYEKIEQIELKYKSSSSVSEKIQECKKYISDLEEETKKLILVIETQKSVNLKKAMNLYFELLKKYEILEDELNINEIKNNIKVLESNIKYEYQRAVDLRNEAKEYQTNKNYRNSMECLIQSNELLKKLDLENEIAVNDIAIRKLKNLISSEIKEIKQKSEKTSIKKVDKEKERNQIINSINLSIKKGDSYIKEDEWNSAIIEYRRALDFCETIGIHDAKYEKLKKKLGYAIKKSNGGWWKIWK
jgi:hypothetical protein